MADETVVAKLLLRLKQSQATASASAVPAVIPLRWGMRLPRSRPGTMTATNSSSLRCDVVLKSKEGGGGDSSTRCSPTTPLSWSGGGDGGASPSGTGDGFEETSRRHLSSSPPPPGVRSKVVVTTHSLSLSLSVSDFFSCSLLLTLDLVWADPSLPFCFDWNTLFQSH